ncbi:MAG: hypothetical protein U1F23_01280 [Lysobacterales bacterium]
MSRGADFHAVVAAQLASSRLVLASSGLRRHLLAGRFRALEADAVEHVLADCGAYARLQGFHSAQTGGRRHRGPAAAAHG